MFGSASRATYTFDRSILKKRWKRWVDEPMAKKALYIRKVAINSIRNAHKAKTSAGFQSPSKPGRPPKTRAAGHPMRKIIADKIGTSTRKTSWAIGSVKLTSKQKGKHAPQLHEHGGKARREFREPKFRESGSRGVTYIPLSSVRKKGSRWKRVGSNRLQYSIFGRTPKGRGKRKTVKIYRIANHPKNGNLCYVIPAIIGTTTTKTKGRYPKRSFMKPALKKGMKRMSKFWKSSLKG